MKIIPSLVEPTPLNLFAAIKRLSPFYQRFQVDIEDGKFIPYKTLSIDDLVTYIQKERSSPLLKHIALDFHLMVNDYHTHVQKINSIRKFVSIDTILIHSFLHPEIRALSSKFPSLQIGLVLNPPEQVDDMVMQFDLSSVPIIQLMTVYPGLQGQSIIPEMLQKIEQLRKQGYGNQIYLDGGINEKSVPMIRSLQFQPDALCPGSFLINAPRLEERVAFLNA